MLSFSREFSLSTSFESVIEARSRVPVCIVNSFFNIAGSKIESSPLSEARFHEILREDLLLNIVKTLKGFYVSTVEVKIWQIFIIYKANWSP